MLERIRGFRTIIVGVLLVLYALSSVAGIDVPDPDGETALTVTGALMIALRLVTNGPVPFRE